MESNPHSDSNPSAPVEEQEEQQAQNTLSLSSSNLTTPYASISLSLSSLFSSSSILSSPKPPFKPSQTACFTHIPLKPSVSLQFRNLNFSQAPKSNSKSSISAASLSTPLFQTPHLSSEPSNPVGGRKCSIVWFRNDLRVHDNEALNSANEESISLLPVYIFDPRDYGKSSSGFDKTGPYRATFLLDCVSNLRENLKKRGSDLVVRIGKPESVLTELVKAVGADGVYAHMEVSHDEVKGEERVEKVIRENGVECKLFWGSTLYHIEDLPFGLEDMPSNYGGFRERVKGLAVRKTIEALDRLKGMPKRGGVEPGDLPTLMDLGLSPASTVSKDGKPAANASLVGGETEALERLKRFASECLAQPYKGDKANGRDSIYGANFSCKISPWLAMGCLSPRFMFNELKKGAKRMGFASVSQKTNEGATDGGMNWLMFELLWRDFFRFITKKYSSNKKNIAATPATACTGALA
ncbi:blue-light photoreceptor PHR2 [Amborella trichopoda]|uniref:Photolyase/cryptochrome alpha/beta domain-containing protein n=1 Tax=Amborella trichopoda TaxID=13333 RepID=U5D6E9_AMBTC|nr:blue-light photoreceptor PHR2 [Amborella trichopoda]ERN15938.1 hypothetical protein AMTR_s00039p00234990 [Amborella trichopoda]|eukprot:XP_006854471.1 blue-light photoreceptor PHR2 [Amborella trichopoda]